MRHPLLVIGLVMILSACSNAVFKGRTGSSSPSNNPTTPSGDATGTPTGNGSTPGTNNNPGTPGTPGNPGTPGTPGTDNPDTQKPGPDTCDMMSLWSVNSLYQLQDETCKNKDPDDGVDENGSGGGYPDDDDDDDDGDDNQQNDNPSQN